VANSMTDKSITHVNTALSNDVTHEVSPKPTSLTEVLRRALIEHPNEAGALGWTWTAREAAVREATQFCQARPVDCVASANGDYHAREYEFPGEIWGVVVWYTHTALITK
jgi:hypothetical protein